MRSSRIVSSPLGRIYLEAIDGFLSICAIEGQSDFKENVSAYALENEEILDQTELWLDEYFKGNKPDPSPIPLQAMGTEYELDVWDALKDIPYGETRTYGEIAEIVSKNRLKKTSARAVGRAIGKNPISIIVPCHRVIGSNHKLVGYNGGTDKKECLLIMEKSR